MLFRLLAITATLVVVFAACGGDDDGGAPTDSDNVLTNGDLEDEGGWSARSGPATISSDQVRNGSGSLLTTLSIDEDSPASAAEFAAQTLTLEEVPEFLSFDYYVDDWVRGTDNQYIEAAIIVEGTGAGMPECPEDSGTSCPNIQIRYVLAGITSAPSPVINARWRFEGDEEPTVGEWLHFESDVRNDMTEAWTSLPLTVTSVKLQLEVRYEGRSPDELDSAADVYWDNVYFGPR